MKTKIVTDEHVFLALTGYLRSLSMIEDNEEVIAVRKVPYSMEVSVDVAKEK